MLPLLLLAGLSLNPVEVDEPVLDARVADIDADGREDVVFVTVAHLYLMRGGVPPLVRRKAPPLAVVGRGLFGVVREGRYRTVADPFGDWKEGEPQAASLLASLGKAEPILLLSPGDLDGDGKDDPILSGPEGFHTPLGLVPVRPEAKLEIYGHETFAVEYRIPVPTVGNWSGIGRELAFFHDGAVASYRGEERTDEIALPLGAEGRAAAAIRRDHVFLRDIDGDGRLDLLLIMARGSTSLFGAFEATARHFPGGRVYDHERKGFYRPASFLKIAGALLKPALLDLDSDGDLDLVLSTINTSIVATATGQAPGTYHLFRFADGTYQRNPQWTHKGPVPMSSFTDQPEPPVTFLPDLDGDGRPEALARGEELEILEAGEEGAFRPAGKIAFRATRAAVCGRSLAVVCGAEGVLVVGSAK